MIKRIATTCLLAAMALSGSCGGPRVLEDPLGELARSENSPRLHRRAMEQIENAGGGEAYEKALHRLIWVPGYTVDVREAALERLERRDLPGLQRTIRQRLPHIDAWMWLNRLCAIVAERRWVELSPALVSSWARPAPVPDEERPEYLALADLHGSERVTGVVFELMLEADALWQEGFRTRCWALLHRLGERHRVVELIEDAGVAPDDAMLVDLRAAALDLGIIPRNREEILWIRTLREPECADFWSRAAAGVDRLPPERREELELRDLPVLVAAMAHDQELLEASPGSLIARLRAHLENQPRYATRGGPNSRFNQKLEDVDVPLTWGDCAAMLLAAEALRGPEMIAHLFDYARRDAEDESTEYGGVIDLDERGRFKIEEFPPRIRHHDQKFIASQEMFDSASTALFHFHFHVQRTRNHEFAGPGMGDRTYADNTRANCLVFTSVGEGRLNVDYYRHGGVVVDLGVVER